ncbi:MAG: ATP synthase F1 subunit epsilon [Candidatus Omnitrophota bacterium]|jgi:F-type H+-transporting ATPase subunit epsilon
MEKKFKVNILTPLQEIYSGEAISVIVPAYAGYLGVLANHAPLIAQLVPGKITLRSGAKTPSVIISKSEGLLEVFDNNVNILLDNDNS